MGHRLSIQVQGDNPAFDGLFSYFSSKNLIYEFPWN